MKKPTHQLYRVKELILSIIPYCAGAFERGGMALLIEWCCLEVQMSELRKEVRYYWKCMCVVVGMQPRNSVNQADSFNWKWDVVFETSLRQINAHRDNRFKRSVVKWVMKFQLKLVDNSITEDISGSCH